ncbi:putative cytochrome p450 protein [Rosellinia necatrix]|uniref:Putative cytochrome p450 protein n=1 Tax=Rosellinia necatrix TaxID=77044 RepID=A0A1W2TK11_ROSNE|nr:putative cytochrome p450 protein [Rosellinia necatrix]
MESIRNLMPEGLPMSLQVVGATVLLGVVYTLYTMRQQRAWPAFPLISVRGKGPRKSWMLHGKEVLNEGSKINGPFQVMTGTGPKIVLPNRYADEIRNLPELNFPKAFIFDFFVNYPGFEAHKQSMTHDFLLRDTVRIKLTQSLGLVTGDLVDETIATVDDVFGGKGTVEGEGEEGKGEWATRMIRDDLLEVVARVSSRVFLGAGLCRNRRWLDIAKTFTVDTFALTFLMRMAPAPLRPLAYLVLPQSARLRRSVRDAHDMIVPEVARRKAAVDAARAAGEKPPKVADTIGWMYDVAKGEDLDFVSGQLSLTMAAIHTTTESTCRALLDVCAHPDVAQMLRDEIVEVVGREGWAKTTLYKLRLMDSFLKESQRVSPLATLSMNRYVEKTITLSDGLSLPKGSRICVLGDFANPEVYPEPGRFDAARFAKKRLEPGQENGWQFVTTSAAHLNFGHGEHACPGRFFAANEIKIILCHLLLKYDWRFVPGLPEPEPRAFEATMAVRPDTQIQACRRKPEIDLDAL